MGPRLGGFLTRFLIHFPRVTLWRGEDEGPARELPVRAGNWTAGTTQAFVIELLDPGGAVAFRIYYQDSPTVAPYGYPDKPTKPGEYQLAILCMGGATEYREFPRDIVGYLAPAYVMGIHWKTSSPVDSHRAGGGEVSCGTSGIRSHRPCTGWRAHIARLRRLVGISVGSDRRRVLVVIRKATAPPHREAR